MGTMVMDVLRKLCASDSGCQRLMCQDDVTNALLAPITNWLDKKVKILLQKSRLDRKGVF